MSILHRAQLRRAAEAIRADATDRYGAAVTVLDRARLELVALGCDDLVDMVDDALASARYQIDNAAENAAADAAAEYADWRRDQDGR